MHLCVCASIFDRVLEKSLSNRIEKEQCTDKTEMFKQVFGALGGGVKMELFLGKQQPGTVQTVHCYKIL